MARQNKPPIMKPKSAKLNTDGTISLNLAGVEGSRRRRTRVPEGNYAGKVSSAKMVTYKSGNKGLDLVFELRDGQFKGVPFWEHLPFINADGTTMDQNLWRVRGVLEALGVAIPERAFRIKPEALKGKEAGLGIVDGEDQNGKVVSEINDIFPIEQLDGEDEDEADEVEEDEEDEEEEEEDEDEDEEEDIDLS
jgi:Protein of unknown function (DUF669)